MSLTGLKLFGSTVKSFTTNVGWGSERSSVKVSLVQDLTLGDYFLPPPIGALSYVTFYELNFWGILQKWTQSASADGLPTFEVQIEDPRSILEGAEVILSGYNGSTMGVPNLMNVFGFLENTGFGNSRSNEGGIPWSLAKPTIEGLSLGGATAYGGPLSYKGYFYGVDLSGIPPVPSYYRIGGSTNMTLMEIISKVCADAGCDFFVDLAPGTTIIRVRTVSRRTQPPTGYIQELVNNATDDGNCIRSQVGLEAINQVTSAFIVGAPVQIMYENPSITAIHPYFGKDVNNNPILSTGIGLGLTTILNSSEVKDIILSNGYLCTALEMCCALASRDTWDAFITDTKPVVAAAAGVIPAFGPPLIANPLMPQDILNLTPAGVLAAAGAQVEDISIWTAQRMFNFVKKAAEQFLGKKFLVEIPFMFTATEPETGRIIHSYDVAYTGYVDTGLPPLGLHPIYQDTFADTSGMYSPMAQYGNLNGTDLSRIQSTDFLIDIYNGGGIYVNMSVGDEIIFLDELTPCVEITINNPLYEPPEDGTGAGIAEIAAVLHLTPEQAQDLFQKLPAGNAFGKISPMPRQPDFVAIPLKSNILTYGPWYGVGAEGKVNFQQDSGLAPWNYGGSAIMNLTANARVTDAITLQQSSESGTVEIVGPPAFNIGDQLSLLGESIGGPTITGIDVTYSQQGVTSNYRLQTFTVKFGAFSKDNVERLRRIALKNQELRHETREAFNRLLVPREVVNDVASILGAGAINQWPEQFKRQSPHSVFMGLIDDNDDDMPRVGVTTHSDKEIAPGIPANDPTLFDKSAMMSITGLIRPINTDYNSNWLASYEAPNANYKAQAQATFIDPFKTGNDIELYTYGGAYADAHAYLNGGPPSVRGFGLRGPLVISGWGWSVDDVFVPNAEDTPGVTDYLRQSWYWKTGPVDLLWDDERQVWTPHGTMLGKLTTICQPGGSAVTKVWDDNGPIGGRARDRTVWNFFSKPVLANKKIIASWIPEAQKWYIIAADCDS